MGLLLMKFMYCRIVTALILYGIWLSPPHVMYFVLSLIMIGAMLCSSLKTSDVLEVKAAEAWVPGMVWTDVNVSVSGIICCFEAKINEEALYLKDRY